VVFATTKNSIPLGHENFMSQRYNSEA